MFCFGLVCHFHCTIRDECILSLVLQSGSITRACEKLFKIIKCHGAEWFGLVLCFASWDNSGFGYCSGVTMSTPFVFRSEYCIVNWEYLKIMSEKRKEKRTGGENGMYEAKQN